MQQAGLHAANLVGQLPIAFRRASLAPELGGSLLLVAQDLAQSSEVRFRRPKLLLRILATGVQAGDASRFLEQLPALDGLRGNHRANAALADQRRGVGARRGIREQQGYILRADVLAVDPVGRSGAAFDPASDFAFARPALIAGVPFDEDRDFREIARRTGRGACEDDIVHSPAAKRLGAGFTHGPADGLEKVGLAAAVRPDDSGQTWLDPKFGRFDEALETAELEPPNPQPVSPSP